MAADKDTVEAMEIVENTQAHDRARAVEFEAPMEHIRELNEAEHLNLSWRSWLVVFVTCFAIMAQVFVVVAAGSVIAFIIRDLGDGAIAAWIIRWSHPYYFFLQSLTILLRGTTAHAICAVTDRRPAE